MYLLCDVTDAVPAHYLPSEWLVWLLYGPLSGLRCSTDFKLSKRSGPKRSLEPVGAADDGEETTSSVSSDAASPMASFPPAAALQAIQQNRLIGRDALKNEGKKPSAKKARGSTKPGDEELRASMAASTAALQAATEVSRHKADLARRQSEIDRLSMLMKLLPEGSDRHAAALKDLLSLLDEPTPTMHSTIAMAPVVKAPEQQVTGDTEQMPGNSVPVTPSGPLWHTAQLPLPFTDASNRTATGSANREPSADLDSVQG